MTSTSRIVMLAGLLFVGAAYGDTAKTAKPTPPTAKQPGSAAPGKTQAPAKAPAPAKTPAKTPAKAPAKTPTKGYQCLGPCPDCSYNCTAGENTGVKAAPKAKP